MKLVQVRAPTSEPIHMDEAKQHLRVDSTDEDYYINNLIAAVRSEVENHRNECLVAQTWDLKLDDFPDDSGDIVVPRVPLLAVSSITYVDTSGTTQTLSASVYTVDTDSKPGRIALAYQQSWPTARDQISAVAIRFATGYQVPFTVSTSGDTLTPQNYVHPDNSLVRFSISGDEDKDLPGGLQTYKDYWVVSGASGTFKVSESYGGTAVDITSEGLPADDEGAYFINAIPPHVRHAMLLMVGHFYENREPVVVGQIVSQIPNTMKFLLDTERVYEFA